MYTLHTLTNFTNVYKYINNLFDTKVEKRNCICLVSNYLRTMDLVLCVPDLQLVTASYVCVQIGY